MDKELKYPWSSDLFKGAWIEWKDYKKESCKFQYKTIRSEQAALNDLALLAQGSEQAALKIINRSIANQWKGLHRLEKNDETGNDTDKLLGFAKRISGIK